jgi:hypothetical protein
VQWWWIACAGLLDPDYPLSPELAQAFEPYRGRRFGKHEAWEYHLRIQSFATPRLWPELGRWARASILQDPGGYARAVIRALGWQLEVYRTGDQVAQSELREDFLKRAQIASYRPAEHIQFSPLFHDFHRTLYIESAGGPLRAFVGWYAGHYSDGLPQVPLAALSLLALLLALLRRQWPLVLVLLGAFALVGVNVITLTAPSRYSVPAWAIFYLGAALVPALLVGRSRRLATAPDALHALPPLRRPATLAERVPVHSAGATGADALVLAGSTPPPARSNSTMG